MNPKNSLLRPLAVFALLFCASFPTARAQTLKTLGNYQPSVIPSESAAEDIYASLPTRKFKGGSGCFQRAHNWAFQLFQEENLYSMKVFLFFTERYKREFSYEWMYHVAPLIPVKMNDGSVQELVFDPTFVTAPSWALDEDLKFYDNKPIPVEKWISYFVIPDTVCPVVENYQDYFEYQERYYCYLMKTPMYTYIPANVESEPAVRMSWREGDLEQMKKAFKLDLNLDLKLDLNLNGIFGN